MKLKIIVFITVESVRESTNYAGLELETNAILVAIYCMVALSKKEKGKKLLIYRIF